MARNINDILTRLLTLALLAMVSVGSAWGQEQRMSGELADGYYKIINVQNKAEWYLVPAQDPDDPSKGVFKDGKPILTTKKTNDKGNFTWRLKKVGGCYQMINAYFWNYVHDDGPDNGTARCAHMEPAATDNDAAYLFHIDYRESELAYTIYGGIVANKSTTTSFNNFGGSNTSNYLDNYNQTNGDNGVIGYWSWASDTGSQWYIEKAPCPKPRVNYDSETGKISFYYPIADENVTFRYTTDGTEPSSASTAYSAPLTVSETTTYKVIATREGFQDSEVVNCTKVATPVFDLTAGNSVAITCATEAATIYYTTDGSTPTTESLLYGEPLTDGVSGKKLKAIAVKPGYINSEVAEMTESFTIGCAAPVIKRSGNSAFTLSCSFPTEGVTIYYTINDATTDLAANPTSGTVYAGDKVSLESLPATIRCIAVADGYRNSTVSVCTIFQGSGTTADPYLIEAASDFDQFISLVNDETEGDAAAYYLVVADFSVSSAKKITAPFKGVFDGGYHTISSLSHALFEKVSGGTVKNVALKDVNISGGTNMGAICNEADGATRIYNCGVLSGSVSGTKYVGGLVGLLDGTSRVINCFSYADIEGGSDKGGIVGYNNVASTNDNLTTMVMNCMFYGDIAEGGNISPIYGGTEINNVNGGLPNYNYYRYDAPYSKNGRVNKYNRALAMQEKFITRFERYRLLLNSNRPMAAFYATGSVSEADNEMAKWVLETADRTIAEPKPYPVLKMQGKYPSIINYDAENAPDSASVGRGQGGQLGNKTLTVNISGVGSNYPLGASLVNDAGQKISGTRTLTLNRTDKDFDRFNYNYDKVQLPYYNDVGTGNYTGNRVVTGWKITSIEGGTPGTYKAADEWGGYNFADRNCTDKDLYSVSGRVFSQGAYFDVPNGVTAITIEPYWGQAAYVCDNYYDVNYNSGYTAGNVTVAGKQYDNGTDIDLYGDGNTQKVYTTINNARSSMNIPTSGKTVYDYAVVLVGNVHQYAALSKDNTPYTLMSVDLNHDNEPDCSFIFSHDNRQAVSPIRFDFLNIVGISDAQMPNGASAFRNVSLFNLSGWFEVTNTCLIHFSEFEYDNSNGDNNSIAKSPAPLILLGGTFQQFVSTQKANNLKEKHTPYIHIGSNVWFSKFGNGTHSDGKWFTPHIPISVTGGDYDEFYLSGTFQPNITNMEADNAECYVSGGHFGEMAAGSLEPIHGDVRWGINWADISSFYGGGTNANQPITGDIRVDIANSHVTLFCGGPKFGDMTTGKTVTTNANGCTFGTFFGAGYGGNSYNRVKYYDEQNKSPSDYQQNYTNDRGKYFDGKTTNAPGKADYGKKGEGVATDFDYEFFAWATGVTGGRFYVKFVSFSLATTHNVTSTLKGCTVTGNFYGGGSLGKVSGNATSTLSNCQVAGSVFGAGFSATLPTIDVRKAPPFTVNPSINKNIGFFEMGEINGTEVYHWKQVEPSLLKNNTTGMESTTEGNFVWTAEDLSTLGTVSGNATLNITGGETLIEGDVYGGGALANANNTTVNLLGGTVQGNVYGGGMGNATTAASVGNTAVNLNKDVSGSARGCVVKGSIFGCNNVNGTPTGTATVHVYATQNASATTIANPAEGEQTAKTKGRYDVKAVYGGGNEAAYRPTDGNGKTQVIIDGCDLTSIEYVYGGGNAAPVSATEVTVNGCYEIGSVFGGGNGKDPLADGSENPGADVGYQGEEAYGLGTTQAIIRGGTVHSVFGGSNTRGNVRTRAEARLDEAGDCSLSIDEVYGGGNEAYMAGHAGVTLGCVTYLNAIYGGAKRADIDGDIDLRITSGRFDQIFGGNNLGGTINGSITVTVEETGCHPVEIVDLYGCGNQAPYSTPEGKADPQVNIISCTSIDHVFGGGYGEAAVVTGNPTVNINQKAGRYAGRIDADGDGVADGNAAALGTLGTIFGGGNHAKVEGDTHVNIGTADEGGANIIGNVYGGGNQAEVTGNASVVIGKRAE